MPTPNNIKDIPGTSRMFYIFNEGNLYFAGRYEKETPILKVAISNMDEFYSRMKPASKGRILTASELNDLMSQASFIPPCPIYPIDEKIIKDAQKRLDSSALAYENYLPSHTSSQLETSPAQLSVNEPQATPTHYIPQIFVDRYVPPPILPDSTQNFEAQFPKVPETPLRGQSMFRPKANQHQTENSEKALAPG
jgi:hypothetical protein